MDLCLLFGFDVDNPKNKDKNKNGSSETSREHKESSIIKIKKWEIGHQMSQWQRFEIRFKWCLLLLQALFIQNNVLSGINEEIKGAFLFFCFCYPWIFFRRSLPMMWFNNILYKSNVYSPNFLITGFVDQNFRKVSLLCLSSWLEPLRWRLKLVKDIRILYSDYQ